MTPTARIFLVALAAGLAACSERAGLVPSIADVPKIAENFRLADAGGKPFELYSFADAPAIVLLTAAPGDPVSAQSVEALKSLATAPEAKGAVFAILEWTDAVAKDDSIRTLFDKRQLVGEALGVTHGGEAFVIDPKRWAIVYHGPVDDRFSSRPPKAPRVQPVRDALAALAARKPVALASYEAGGAPIAFAGRNDAASARISYTQTVAPILLAKCTPCHVKAGPGPFAMTDYATVKHFAFMIRAAIRTQKMPPVDSERRDGPFAHVVGLSDREARTIVHWIEAGAQRGDGPDPLAAQPNQANAN